MIVSASQARLAAVALLFAGCMPVSPAIQPAGNQVHRTDVAPDVYPLHQGMTWTYRLTQFKGGQPTGRQDTMTSRVVALTGSGAAQVAKVHRMYGSLELPSTQAIRTGEYLELARWPQSPPSERVLPIAGVRPESRGHEITTSLRILRFPLQVGASWAGREWTFAKETLTARGWEAVEVPEGPYQAWRVDHRIAYDDGRIDNLAYWYAPNVGMIKAHEESTLVMSGTPLLYAVDGELTDVVRP